MIDPPRPKSPPLNALRAFEAAARLESFALAAQELAVTPSAVAQQVKALEAWIGHPLFDREPQRLRLNASGRAALPSFVRAFDALGDAVQALRRETAPTAFRIAALPSVAQLWLSPRLPALRRAFPDLTVSVTALEHPPNLIRDPIDVALFFESGTRDGLATQVLAEAERFPVCAPILAGRLATPSDLATETLLHDATWRDDWPAWIQLADARGVDPSAGPVFSLYSLALEEALRGAGVLMGAGPLVDEALASGSLVRPFAPALPGRAALTATYRASDAPAMAPRIAALLGRA